MCSLSQIMWLNFFKSWKKQKKCIALKQETLDFTKVSLYIRKETLKVQFQLLKRKIIKTILSNCQLVKQFNLIIKLFVWIIKFIQKMATKLISNFIYLNTYEKVQHGTT